MEEPSLCEASVLEAVSADVGLGDAFGACEVDEVDGGEEADVGGGFPDLERDPEDAVRPARGVVHFGLGELALVFALLAG